MGAFRPGGCSFLGMADLTPRQRATRARFEGLIGLAAPFLDVVLGVGERISRIAEPTDHEYYPVRPAAERQLPARVGEDDGPDPDSEGAAGPDRGP
jgi:hypothetical protein